jgi:hypothetical protein
MESLPVELIIEISLYLSYRDLTTCRQVNHFFQELLNDPSFWRRKINRDYPNSRIVLPGPNRWDYLRRLTDAGECERGSERFISRHQCLIRAIDRDDSSMIDYFSPSSSRITQTTQTTRTGQFIQAVLHNNLQQLYNISFQGELKLFDVNISHADLIVLARWAIRHNCYDTVRFFFNYTPTSIESVMPTVTLDSLEPDLREYLLELYRLRDGFMGWAYINQFKRPPITDTSGLTLHN